jgi:hypothetical protein
MGTPINVIFPGVTLTIELVWTPIAGFHHRHRNLQKVGFTFLPGSALMAVQLTGSTSVMILLLHCLY